ncbi:TrmO family methyltransferase [Balneolaceae bacterium ANBcel3]|nr:TrmO family methyltransferase [Balneolaceae bacterium ANBcel3]
MESISFQPIGVVENDIRIPEEAHNKKKGKSVIVLDRSMEAGLDSIEASDFIEVVFYFHKSDEADLHVRAVDGKQRGVFATRSPRRPNGLGITVVKLTGRKENRLEVYGLDAINGTPILDIKPCDTSCFEEYGVDEVSRSIQKNNPRMEIWKHILAGDTETLLLQAGQIHGHYCPGLAMGVMAATQAMQKLGKDSDGMEDLLAIVETNNCLSDGVQWVTGCTIGNNALIYYDLGKMAFTLTQRDGKGIRFIARHEAPQYIKAAFPDFDRHYDRVVRNKSRNSEEIAAFKMAGMERAFGTLGLDITRLFDVKQVQTEIPEYAPSYESLECSDCGESVMAARVSDKEGQPRCFACAGEPVSRLDGYGLHVP